MRGHMSRIEGALFFCLAALILTFPAATARAETIVFDNFGPGDTYDTGFAYLLANDGDWQSAWAFQFQPSASGYVSDIWLPVNLFRSIYSKEYNLQIALMTDSGADRPQDVLETWTFSVLSRTSDGIIVHGIGNGTTEISEGVKYWLAGTVPSGTDSVTQWYSKPIEPTDADLYFYKESIGFEEPWGSPSVGTAAAFRIAVSTPPQAVPSMSEYGMMIFLALVGSISLVYLRKQTRES